jgi:hypothetical protein
MIISLLYLHVLGESVDVASLADTVPVMLVVSHVEEGWQVARSSDVATRGD